MTHQHTTPRILSILILFGLVIAQLGAVQPAQAADPVTVTLDNTAYSGLPGNPITVKVTEVFGDLSTEQKNISIDTLIALAPAGGTDLGGLTIQALAENGTPIGMITLIPGQTSFWASSFGGVLSRRRAQTETGSTRVYQFVFTASKSLADQSIGVSAQIAVAKNGWFDSPIRWKYSAISGSSILKVNSLPIVASTNISGPYLKNTLGNFQVVIYNPPNGASLSGLHLQYQFDNDGATSPIITTFTYQYQLDNGPIIAGGDVDKVQKDITPSAGYSLAAGQTLTININIKFENDKSHFPISLFLIQPGIPNKILSTLSSVAVVEIENAELVSSDLGSDFNIKFTAGVLQEFHVTAVNKPGTGGNYPAVYMKFSFGGMAPTDILAFQYYSPTDGLWHDMPIPTDPGSVTKYGPFPFNNTDHLSMTVKFQVSFARPGLSYPVQVSLETGDGTPIPNTTMSKSVEVIATDPVLDLSGVINSNPFGESTPDQPFTVRIINPSTGGTYSQLRLDYVISAIDPANITQLEYSLNNGATWSALVLAPDGNGGAAGSINPGNWQITPGQTLPINFRVNFAPNTSQKHVMTFTLVNISPFKAFPAQSVYFDIIGIPVTGGPTLYLPVVNK